jgi:hypothetical protein
LKQTLLVIFTLVTAEYPLAQKRAPRTICR